MQMKGKPGNNKKKILIRTAARYPDVSMFPKQPFDDSLTAAAQAAAITSTGGAGSVPVPGGG